MNKSILHLLARSISNLFLPPVFLLFCGITVSLTFLHNSALVVKSISVIAFFGLILPVAFFLFLMKQNKVGDQDASKREQRTLPFAFGIAVSVLAMITLILLDVSSQVLYFWSSYLYTVIVIAVINNYWKISAHTMSVGAGSMVLMQLGLIPPYGLVAILVLVGWARLHLLCHTSMQVIVGAVTGCIIALVNYLYFAGL